MIKVLTVLSLLLIPITSWAEEEYIKISAKEIIERLTRIEGKLEMLEKRIDDVNKRIGDLEASLNKRIDDLRNIIYVILASILTLAGAMIALAVFVVWDRRSVIRPVERKVIDAEAKIDVILEVLKERAKKDPELAGILRTYNLL
jgi:methyl-accepting chemotaxis protein